MVVGAFGDRPADILVKGWFKGRNVFVDFTVVSPMTLEQWPLSPEKARRHLGEAEKAKVGRESDSCARLGWGHHPTAYFPWGGEGAGAAALLREVLARVSADLVGWPKISRIVEVRHGLSFTLARGVAAQLAIRCRVVEFMRNDLP